MELAHALLSPLSNWRGGETALAAGLRIRKLEDGHHFCHEFDNPHPPGSARNKKRREAAVRLLTHAAYASQILVPCGWTGVIRTPETTEHRMPFLPTAWGARCVVPPNVAEEAPLMLERVQDVFLKPILRLQIAIWLLEQGMGAPDQHIRILLCATGLDSLTRASGQAAFSERLSNLLGGDSLIFPPDEAGRQPRYRVADVAGHLYQLRNEMAHGLPFQAIFHKKTGFLATDGEPVAPEFARYRYDKVLEECAVFLLCRALREVLLKQLIFDLHMLEWRTTEA